MIQKTEVKGYNIMQNVGFLNQLTTVGIKVYKKLNCRYNIKNFISEPAAGKCYITLNFRYLFLAKQIEALNKFYYNYNYYIIDADTQTIFFFFINPGNIQEFHSGCRFLCMLHIILGMYVGSTQSKPLDF